jgi:hypothetical protein
VIALAVIASTVVAINDAVAALSDLRDRVGIQMPRLGPFPAAISNGFFLLGSGLLTGLYPGTE